MISYEKACEIAKSELKDYFKHFDKVSVTEVTEGWVFVFGKSGSNLTPAPTWLIKKESGELKPFPIPPVSNLKKLKKGQKINFIVD